MTDYIEIKLPVFLLPAIDYGDTDQLDQDDQKALDAYYDLIASIEADHADVEAVLHHSYDQYFEYYPDFATSGCDCVKAKINLIKV